MQTVDAATVPGSLQRRRCGYVTAIGALGTGCRKDGFGDEVGDGADHDVLRCCCAVGRWTQLNARPGCSNAVKAVPNRLHCPGAAAGGLQGRQCGRHSGSVMWVEQSAACDPGQLTRGIAAVGFRPIELSIGLPFGEDVTTNWRTSVP